MCSELRFASECSAASVVKQVLCSISMCLRMNYSAAEWQFPTCISTDHNCS